MDTWTNVKANAANLSKSLKDINEKLKELLAVVSVSEHRLGHPYYDDYFEGIRFSFFTIKPKLESLESKLFPKYTGFIDVKNLTSDASFFRQLNDEKRPIYAASFVGEQMKYGKIFATSTEIFIYSLSLTEREPESSWLWLHEFKNRYHLHLCSFIEFPCSKNEIVSGIYPMIFEIIDSHRHSGFLELCTGEANCSFKDAFCNSKKDYMLINLESMSYILNCYNDNVQVNNNDIIFRFLDSDIWEIKRVTLPYDFSEGPRNNIVAKVNPHMEFPDLYISNIKDRRIRECGIAIFRDLEYMHIE